MNSRSLAALLALGFGLVAGPVLAATPAAPALLAHQTPLVLNEAASAWILTSTALVLLMTLPGLALFYGGMVRRKNVLSTIAHSTAALQIVYTPNSGNVLVFGLPRPERLTQTALAARARAVAQPPLFRYDLGGYVEQAWLDANVVAVHGQILRDASGTDSTGVRSVP